MWAHCSAKSLAHCVLEQALLPWQKWEQRQRLAAATRVPCRLSLMKKGFLAAAQVPACVPLLGGRCAREGEGPEEQGRLFASPPPPQATGLLSLLAGRCCKALAWPQGSQSRLAAPAAEALQRSQRRTAPRKRRQSEQVKVVPGRLRSLQQDHRGTLPKCQFALVFCTLNISIADCLG